MAMDNGTIDPVASWIQAGGVVAFAAAVWWELRQLRPLMTKVSEMLVAVLEHVRGSEKK